MILKTMSSLTSIDSPLRLKDTHSSAKAFGKKHDSGGTSFHVDLATRSLRVERVVHLHGVALFLTTLVLPSFLSPFPHASISKFRQAPSSKPPLPFPSRLLHMLDRLDVGGTDVVGEGPWGN